MRRTRSLGKAIRVASMIAAASTLEASQATAQNTPNQAPRNRSGIAGVVRDSIGAPIRLASILVDGSKQSAVSDDSGHFDLRGLPSGPNGFTVAKIGYAPVSFETSLPPDSVLVLAIRMLSVQTLGTVNVTSERVNVALARSGFFERRRLGFGSFLSPAQVDSMADLIVTPSQFLRGLRGIDLKCGGTTCVPIPRNYTSCLLLFVDGVPDGPAYWMDSLGLNPNAIAAIEVYDRPATVPIEFQGALPIKRGRGLSAGGGCGAVALWTKTHVPR